MVPFLQMQLPPQVSSWCSRLSVRDLRGTQQKAALEAPNADAQENMPIRESEAQTLSTAPHQGLVQLGSCACHS